MKISNFKKLNIFKTSPLISVIAIVEVIILICVSTFAWFVFADNNNINTDVISVEPDSGLEIDFNDANENDYVNIWNYLNEFQFEPVTSLDGRNLFVPTTGTFNSTETSNIKFREATVNDMNSKYINVDFTLTNTGTESMPVYLSSKTFFRLYDPETEKEVNSKAIRMAFYQNDGSSGKITSSVLSQEYEGEEPTDEPTEDSTDDSGDSQSYFIYFDTTGSNWTSAYIECDYTVFEGNNRRMPMKPVETGSKIYYIDLGELVTKYNTTQLTFMKFHHYASDNGNTNMTVQKNTSDIAKNRVFSFKLDSSGKAYEGSENGHYGLLLNDPKEYTGKVPDVGGEDSGDNGGTEAPTEAPTTPDDENYTTVYFNNTLGWEHPYAYIWRENGDNDEPLSAWPGKPMTHISGSVYYYTFNAKYDSIIFNDGNSQGGAVKTQDISPVKDGYIYMIGSSSGDNEFGWAEEDYLGTVKGGTYPVISPGVSTGFQRPYAPVIQIDDNSGDSKVVIPAFASSIDDYNYGSNNPLFTIEAGQTLPLSMIIWLEGTDPDCTEDVYAGKSIDMNLVFATKDSGEKMYTYKFLDKTKENWIDDRITTDTGVSFKPVIQLYDVNAGKGYQMSVHDDENGKPTIWQCQAPEELVDSDHIMFRRVNPMNEDEVWNYWDTSGFRGKQGAVIDSNVYFSAFSDGAPTTATKDANATEEANAPTRSCGGLWGDHETQILTIYDGTEGQWIKNSDQEGRTSVLTMNYTYDGQEVEYKASGSGNDMYYFVVPECVYSKTNSNRPPITFKRYYNFNSAYALNSDRNNLVYHMKWANGVCNGLYGQITGNSSSNFYWGSDILYVQARNIVTNKMSGSHLQVHFYANTTGAEVSGTSHYTTLYRNDNFAASGDGYGYACVVPSNKNYYKYRVERCNPNKTSEKWNITPLQNINSSSTDDVAYSNTVESNICTIDYLYLRVFLECSTSFCGSSWDPEIYIWDDDGSNGESAKWPGHEMKWSSDTPEGGSSSSQRYVYFSNSGNWGSVYAYFFANGNAVGKEWPGEKLTAYSGSDFKVAIPSGATHVIFNNNNGTQTGDIDIGSTSGAYYYDSNQSLKVSEWGDTPEDAGFADSYKQYYYDVNISAYDHIKFSNDYNNGVNRRESAEFAVGADTDVSGMIYQWKKDGTSRKRDAVKSDIVANETLYVTLYNSIDWP